MTNEELCREAINNFGVDFQFDMLIQECSELIQACIDFKRGKSILSLIEEIADVENMIMQIKYILEEKTKFSTEVKIDWYRIRDIKLKRFEERLKSNRKIEDENKY